MRYFTLLPLVACTLVTLPGCSEEPPATVTVGDSTTAVAASPIKVTGTAEPRPAKPRSSGDARIVALDPRHVDANVGGLGSLTPAQRANYEDARLDAEATAARIQSQSKDSQDSTTPPPAAQVVDATGTEDLAEQLNRLIELKEEIIAVADELRQVDARLEELKSGAYSGGPFYLSAGAHRSAKPKSRGPGEAEVSPCPKWILQWGLEAALEQLNARAKNLTEVKEWAGNSDIRARLAAAQTYQQELQSLEALQQRAAHGNRYARRTELIHFSETAVKSGVAPRVVLRRVARIAKLDLDPDEWLLGWEGYELLAGYAPAGGASFGMHVEVTEIPALLPTLYHARVVEEIVRDRKSHVESMLSLLNDDQQWRHGEWLRFGRRVAENELAIRRTEAQLQDALASRELVADCVAQPDWEDELLVAARQERRELTTRRELLDVKLQQLKGHVSDFDMKAINGIAVSRARLNGSIPQSCGILWHDSGFDVVSAPNRPIISCTIAVYDRDSARLNPSREKGELFCRVAMLQLDDRFPIMRDDPDSLTVYAGDVKVAVEVRDRIQASDFNLRELLSGLIDLEALEQVSPVELPEIHTGPEESVWSRLGVAHLL